VRTSLATAELQVRDRGILLLLDGAESSWIDPHDPAPLDRVVRHAALVSGWRGPSGRSAERETLSRSSAGRVVRSSMRTRTGARHSSAPRRAGEAEGTIGFVMHGI